MVAGMAGLPHLHPSRWPRLTAAVVRGDVVAGATVGLLVVPQGLAYATLAGLPPIHGLYCALLPTVAGALCGWSHQLHTGPVAMSAILVATTLAPLAEPGSARWIELALLLTLLVGVVRLALGLVRASALVRLVSHPVLAGFTAGAALVIAATQLPALLGAPAAGQAAGLPQAAWQALAGAAALGWPVLAMGLGCLAAILVLRRWAPRLPGTLLVVAAATLVSWLAGYPGAVVGAVPAGLPPLTWPGGDAATVVQLLPGALLVALIGFMEVLTVTKACAARTRQGVDLDRELVGQGCAALAAACTAGFVPSGSLSRSALNLAGGARTALSSLAAAAVVALVLVAATPLIAPLPLAALAAAAVAAVLPLVDLGALLRAWRAQRDDGLAGTAAVVLVLALAPRLVEAFLAAVALALALSLRRTMRPRVADCVRHPDGRWRDWRRHGLQPAADLAVLRPDGRLTFAAAAGVEEAVLAVLAERPGVRAVVLACEGVNEVDATGSEMLRTLARQLDEAGVELALSALKAPAEEVLARTGTRAAIPQVFRSTDEAVSALASRLDLAPFPWEPAPWP
jgi:SulP family sulfate permease